MIRVNVHTPSQIQTTIRPVTEAVIAEDHDTLYTISKVSHDEVIIGGDTGVDIILTSSDGDTQKINIPTFTGEPWGSSGTTGLVPPPNEDMGQQFLSSAGTWEYLNKGMVHLNFVTDDRQVKALPDQTSQGETYDDHLIAFSGADGATVKDTGISASDLEKLFEVQSLPRYNATWNGNKYVIGGETTHTYTIGERILVTFDQTNTVDNPSLYFGSDGRALYQNGARIKANQIVPNLRTMLICMPNLTSISGSVYWMILNSTSMTGATSSASGMAGYVPAPSSTDINKFLRGDGTWAEHEEMIQHPQELDTDQDLNTITTEGFYWIRKNNTVVNAPRASSVTGYGQSFSLTVVKSSASSIIQTLIYTGSSTASATYYHETYQRRKLGDAGWTSWIKMLSDQDLVVCTESEYENNPNKTALLYFIKEGNTQNANIQQN